MMTPGRNAPCPCGSGRKYKHCCLEPERTAPSGRTPSPEVREAAAAADVWEADLLPFSGVTGSRPGAATVVSLVMAGGALVRTNLADHPGSEPVEVAESLAAEVRAAIAAIGSTPERLHVGDREVLSTPPASLPTAGGAEGPGADPAAVLTADPERLAHENRELAMDFCDWLEDLGLAPTTMEKHLENVGLLFWYLEAEGVPVQAVQEYDLRCFLFDWVHRKGGVSKSRAAGVPASLRKFFKFLATSRGVRLPWAREVLGDRQLYLDRARSCPHEPFWTERTREWLGELTLDLHERSLLPNDALGEHEEWGGTMGPLEWELHTELRRRWLLWRDEIIRSGVEDHAELLDELHRRQKAWEAEPNPKVGRRTPVEAVLAERAEVGEVVGRRT